MKEIKGINTNYNIDKFIKVSDLIAFDGSLLSHFIDENGENYLFYWVDVDDEYNRWMFLRVNTFSIQKYLEKKITLYNLVLKQSEDFVFFVDIDDNSKFHNIKLVYKTDIDESYIPDIDSYYDFEPVDALDLASFSKKLNSGILELRITGDSIPYGSIPLSNLAPIIPKIEDIRKNMASRFVKERKKQFLNKKSKRESTKILKLDTQYEFVYSLAGSFRMILKPSGKQSSLPGIKTFSDEFAEEFVNLIDAGFQVENINRYSEKYDKSLIKKYSDFIVYLNKSQLGIDVKWYNIQSNFNISKSVNEKRTIDIIKNLTKFNFDDSEELKYSGKFFAINTRSGRYSFESIEGDDFKSSGFFDEDRKKMCFTISFNTTYDVIIHRKMTEQVGGKEKTEDLLISFIESKEVIIDSK